MLKTRLELRGGFEVFTAEDSEKGCRLAATKHPDVILMDLEMPDDDRWEAVRASQERSANLGHPDHRHVRACGGERALEGHRHRVRRIRCQTDRIRESGRDHSARASDTQIDFPTVLVRPVMALSGVRSSWLMLARNCDLCSLACWSWRLLSWISSNSRTFSTAITAWSANALMRA